MDHPVEGAARAAADPKIGAVSAQIRERAVVGQDRIRVAIRADLQRVPAHAVGRVRRAAVDRQGATAQNQIPARSIHTETAVHHRRAGAAHLPAAPAHHVTRGDRDGARALQNAAGHLRRLRARGVGQIEPAVHGQGRSGEAGTGDADGAVCTGDGGAGTCGRQADVVTGRRRGVGRPVLGVRPDARLGAVPGQVASRCGGCRRTRGEAADRSQRNAQRCPHRSTVSHLTLRLEPAAMIQIAQAPVNVLGSERLRRLGQALLCLQHRARTGRRARSPAPARRPKLEHQPLGVAASRPRPRPRPRSAAWTPSAARGPAASRP